MSSTVTRSLRKSLLATSFLATGLLGGVAAMAGTLPTGGAVAVGSATIASGPGKTTITQATNRAVINWGSFSVGQGDTVVFNQPGAGSATLNRVTGTTASSIAGKISSNGAVFLVNPNGIAITSTGQVQTGGGFVASTLAIADADFMAGKLKFAGNGASATVSNGGSIAAGSGAFVALLGGQVANSGTVSVPLGRVALASAEQVTLDLNGGQFLQIAVPTTALTGTNALVGNSGQINAGGGTVLLQAATLKTLVRNVINMPGRISADSATSDGGTIRLLGGDGGTVNVSGVLSARATGATGNGGTVETSGAHVALAGISVSTNSVAGKTGTWSIDPVDFKIAAAGGDITGAALSAALANNNVTILSSSGTTGTNGDVLVNDTVTWSAGTTLKLSSFRNIALAANVTGSGAGAGLVLQADNTGTGIGTVTSAGGAAIDLADPDAFVKVYYNPAVFGTPNAFGFITTGGKLTAYELVNSAANLQLINSRNLNESYALGKDIDLTSIANFVPLGTNGAGTNLNGGYGFAGSFDGLGHTISNLKITRGTVGNVGLFGYVWNGTNATQDFANVNFVNAVVTGNNAVGALIGRASANVTVSNATVSGTITGQAIGASPSTQRAYNIGGLLGSLESTATISTVASTATVTGGTTGQGVGGVIGFHGNGSITNATASGAVSGQNTVGGIAGSSSGSITGSSASGAVSAVAATINGGLNSANQVGGLAGYGFSISNSSATGAVTVTGASANSIGGLAGTAGTITNSSATGAVTASGTNASTIGGLAGSVTDISNATANGTVTVGASANTVGGLAGSVNGVASGLTQGGGAVPGSIIAGMSSSSIGGLIGAFNGTQLTSSTAAGNVQIGNGANSVGGLIGYIGNSGNISQILASGAVTTGTDSSYIGGLIGGLYTYSGVTEASALGNVTTGTGSSAIGGLIGGSANGNVGSISDVQASGNVTGSSNVGGLIGSSFAIVNNASATGAVTQIGVSNGFYSNIGGLIGSNSGALSQVSASGNVTVAAATFNTSSIGGLVGSNSGAINQGSASGTISSNAKANSVGGLIGTDSGSSIFASSATGAVTGRSSVGGLIGSANGSTINQSTATGAVNGTGDATQSDTGFYVGGLVGVGGGTIIQSQASGAVVGASNIGGLVGQYSGNLIGDTASGSVTAGNKGYTSIGGLAGYLSGSINQSSASGNVIGGAGGNSVGGLVGTLNGLIIQSFATGAVSATNLLNAAPASYLGGLVGNMGSGSITRSWASGNVTGDVGSSYLGGLAGNASGSITAAYATGNVGAGNGAANMGGLLGGLSGNAGSVYATGTVTAGTNASTLGGLIGNFSQGSMSKAYATGAVAGGSGSDSLGGLIGYFSNGVVNQTYALGAVSGGTHLGGLVGNSNVLGMTASYWNTQTTGQALATGNGAIAGATGRTTAQMQDYASRATSYAGWDFATVWSPPTQAGQAGQAQAWYPQLYALTPVAVANPNAASRTYGAANPAFTGTLTGGGVSRYLLGPTGDSLAVGGLFGTNATAASPVGTYSLGVPAGGSALSAKGVAYRVIVPTASTLTINPAALTLTYTANAASSAYGAALAPISGTVNGAGFVNGEGVGNLAGAALWQTTATGASNAGVYGITGSGLTSGNYAITAVQAAGNATAYTINPAALTITYTATAASRSYGAANPVLGGTVSASGLVNGNTLASVTTGTATWTTPATTASGAGSYAINGSGLSGTSANYAITFQQAAGNATALLVKPAILTLTYTATAASRRYGAANPALTGNVSASGLVNGDTLATVATGTAVWSTSTNSASPVGRYAITGSGLSASNGNYSISFQQAGANANALIVNPALLTLTYTANPATSAYGRVIASLSGSVTGSGFVNGETVASLGGSALWSTAANSASGVGTYAITGSGLSGSNYTITTVQAAGNATRYSVTPAPLTITYFATPAAMTYGGSVPVLSGSGVASGLVNGDTIGGAAVFGTTASSTSGVGNYAVTGSGLTASANYTVTSVQAPINATALLVNPAVLTVTYSANPASMTYGGSVPALTGGYTVSGLVNGDVESGTAAFATSATSGSPVGSYAVTGSGIGASANYVVNTAQAPGNATALVVNPAVLDLVYTASAASMTYGAAVPTLGGSVSGSGFVNGDTLASLSGAVLWGTDATSASSVGTYQITGYGLTSQNYVIRALQSQNNFRALTINKAALTLNYVATPITRVYGVFSAAPVGTVAATGLVNGDTVATVTTGTAKFTTPATMSSNVGFYAITGSGLTAASTNYTIAFAQDAGNARAFTINRAPLSIVYTATPVARTYGSANPALTGTFTASGFKLTDTAATILGGSPTFTTFATATTGKGKYAINGAGVTSLSNNYQIVATQSFTNAIALTVNPAPLTLTYTAGPITQTYKALNPAAYTGSTTITGLVLGHTQAAAFSGTAKWLTAATSTSHVGSYAINGSGLSMFNSNYVLTTVQAAGNATALTIAPATLTVTYTAAAASSKVGAPLAALSGSASSPLGIAAHPEIFGGTASFTTTATTSSPVGSYGINGSGIISVNSDYILSAVQAVGNATAYTIIP